MRELGIELEREPMVEEIAARSGEDVGKVRSALKHWNFTYQSLNELVVRHHDGSSEGREFGDTMADEMVILPNVSLEIQERLEEESRKILLLLGTLRALPISERNKEAFKAYYGLDGNSEDLAMEDVGARLGVTRERIRQINTEVWKALREAGIEMDEAWLMEQIRRVDELEKLAAVTAVLPLKEEQPSLQEDNSFPTVREKERATIEKVLTAVSTVCEAEKAELTTRPRQGGRHPERLEAQRIAVYLLVEEYKLPLKLITWTFKRAHTFIAESMAKVSEKLETDAAFADKLCEIKKLAKKKGSIGFTPATPTASAPDILTAVAETYGTTPARLTAKGTKRNEGDTLTWARKVATYLLHRDARWNEDQIACEFNNKGMIASPGIRRTIREIKTLLETESDVKEDIENIRARYQKG
jgi:hypothetical protein